MDFQETFQATATTDHFFNYYKNETQFENKHNSYVSTCISIRGVRVRVPLRVHIKFINGLLGAIKLTLH